MAKKRTKKKSTLDEEPTWDQIGSAIGKKMEKGSKSEECMPWKMKMKEKIECQGTGGCFYFLGFIGALIYYITTAPSFWAALVGFFKALVWPAFLVYGLLKFVTV